jgi:hypothetical protein
MLPLLVCVAGIFLGLYFDVLVLLRVSLIGSGIFITVTLSSGLSFYANIVDLLVLLISGQAGYILGLCGRETYGRMLARFHAVQSNRI